MKLLGNLIFSARSYWLPLMITASTLLLSSCSTTDRMSTFDPKGPVAKLQLDLFMVTIWVCCILFVVVAGALAWAVIKYRQRPGDENKPLPEQGHGNPLIEIGLIGGSILLLVVIAIPTMKGIWITHEMPTDDEDSHLASWHDGNIPAGEEDNVLVVKAIGYQWWWTFEYPQLGIRTANEIVIPKGKTVRIELRAKDVIHSFWLPKIAGKVDLIPGRANWMWIQGDEAGHYYGQCAEFCGEAHAYMLFRSDVLEVDDFNQWVVDQTTPAPLPVEGSREAEGLKLFATKTCIQCHRIDGTNYTSGILGPDLSHVASRKSLAAGIMDHYSDYGQINEEKLRENLFEWIRHSEKYKPGNLMYYPANGLRTLVENGDLTDEDVHKIVDYLMTLK